MAVLRRGKVTRVAGTFRVSLNNSKKVRKGVRGMPRLSEAKKDVISCDKLRGGANNCRSVDFRMGQPVIVI